MPAFDSKGLRRGCGRALITIILSTIPVATARLLAPSLTWNVSTSLPRGLYVLEPRATPARGSIVSFPAPASAAELIATRGYLPARSALLKIVVGLPGDRACVGGDVLLVNGQAWGAVAKRDLVGRPLAPFPFCGVIPPGHAFVATSAPRSFDSRYFGPVALSSLTVAWPLWTY
jgi:conjugative transfer signal peptidase TraF